MVLIRKKYFDEITLTHGPSILYKIASSLPQNPPLAAMSNPLNPPTQTYQNIFLRPWLRALGRQKTDDLLGFRTSGPEYL